MFYVVTAERRIFGPFKTAQAARKWAEQPHFCETECAKHGKCQAVVRFIESPE